MGADFYPRLVGAITDKPRANRLVNEQAHVSMLLAGPGVVATLAFAAPVLTLFYTEEFNAAAGLLRWICLGMALRVITWPIGYIIVASNRRLVFFATEFAWTVVNVSLSWLCIDRFGLDGAGIAFFASYVFHAVVVYILVGRMTGFRWSAANRRTGLVYVAAVGVVFCRLPRAPARVGDRRGRAGADRQLRPFGARADHARFPGIDARRIAAPARAGRPHACRAMT